MNDLRSASPSPPLPCLAIGSEANRNCGVASEGVLGPQGAANNVTRAPARSQPRVVRCFAPSSPAAVPRLFGSFSSTLLSTLQMRFPGGGPIADEVADGGEANAIVAPIYAKAMPVLLDDAAGDRPVAGRGDGRGARPATVPAGSRLRIVAKGDREDGPRRRGLNRSNGPFSDA